MHPRGSRGFSLVEALVGVGVFMIIVSAAYEALRLALQSSHAARVKIVATALANEQFEILRNVPYSNVGTQGGVPTGVVPQSQTLVRDDITFDVDTTIRNVDDVFDGTIGGIPNDLSPADYKLAEITISCDLCKNFVPLVFTTRIAPKALETSSMNGALFVRVFDAAGVPVPNATVRVENASTTPPIDITDETNNDGLLQLVDTPPGDENYKITVTKAGYSSERTYAPGDPSNPNPSTPHATVLVQQLTQISFAIDLTSTLDVSSVTDTCAAIPSVDFDLSGTKIIGTSPNILKYEQSLVTNGAGRNTITGLEWDTYSLIFSDATYDLAGSIPQQTLALNPGAMQDFKLVVAPKDPQSLLVTVKDAGTQLPLSGAEVRLQQGVFDETLTTGRGFMRQSDWSGGPGQATGTDPTRFLSSDGNVDTFNFPGEIRLQDVFGNYTASGELTSSSFDSGSPSNFHHILWQPQTQPPDTGSDSVRFQIATNDDNTTWSFKGPDGTGSTYYTIADQNIHPSHTGDRYFRYKLFLGTASTTWTPSISDVSFTFTSTCVPPGQVFFSGLSNGAYDLTVTKSGYQTVVDTVNIAAPWQGHTVQLSP